MKRRYIFPKHQIDLEGNENALITNHYGGYFSILPNSNYGGWYLLQTKDWKFNKIIESITPLESGKQISNIQQFFSLRRVFDTGEDSIFPYNNTLFYNAQNITGKILLTLDNREAYEQSQLGRSYKITQDENYVLIEFTNEPKNQKSYLAIKGISKVEEKNQWKEKNYYEDQKRNAHSNYWVYDSITFEAKSNVVFSYGETPTTAKTRADIAFFHFDEILNYKHQTALNQLAQFKKIRDKNIKSAAICATWSLNNLTNTFEFEHKQLIGIYAGLPWFFHLWSRDELISLGGLIKLTDNIDFHSTKAILLEEENHRLKKLIKQILCRHINSITSDGTLPNIYPTGGLNSKDALGWLGKRVYDFISQLQKEKILFEILTDDDLRIWFDKLNQALKNAKENYGQQGLFANGSCETWMDTIHEDEGRFGYSIEIQALFVTLYDSLIVLSKLINLETKTLQKEKENLIKKIRETFIDEKFEGLLLDRVYPLDLNINSISKTSQEITKLNLQNLRKDKTYRPNIFLACYLAQEILTKKEWEKVFDTHLEKLYLPWGGLASIDQTHTLFNPTYTGQNNKSYHRGDSWYFLNNLSAIAMQKINAKKYQEKIKSIINASTKDILQNGFAGHASELSSAQIQDASGTGAQAWSASTFVELIEEKQNKGE